MQINYEDTEWVVSEPDPLLMMWCHASHHEKEHENHLNKMLANIGSDFKTTQWNNKINYN